VLREHPLIAERELRGQVPVGSVDGPLRRRAEGSS
jgi:hypothetical protein